LEGQLDKLEREGNLEKLLKISSSLSLQNMVLFDKDGKIRKYESVIQILRDFYELRLGFYEKRKVRKKQTMNKNKHE